MKKLLWLTWPGRIILFVLINLFNFRIFDVALQYLHPGFDEAFLISKQHLVTNQLFKIGLIAHGISAVIALFICSVLVCLRIEHSYQRLHRFLGKTALYILFIAVIPGGMILAFYASGGKMGKFLFFLLAIYTAVIAYQLFKNARAKLYQKHQLFAQELLVILCSAILLRLLLIIFIETTELEYTYVYNISIALSWIPTFVVFRIVNLKNPYNQTN